MSSIRFCPQCGSPLVKFSELAGGSASCGACRWAGETTKLLSVPIKHSLTGESDTLVALVNDLRRILSGELGIPYLKFLLKWGFLQADMERLADTLDRKKFGRYLAAISTSIVGTLLETRAALEAEAKAGPQEAN